MVDDKAHQEDTEQTPTSMVGRIMVVLDAFRLGGGPHSLTSISRRTNLPVSTTHRLLTELTQWGALKKTSQGYLVSLKLFEIGLRSYEHELLQQVAQPVMQDLYALTHASVHLSLLDGTEVVFIGKQIGRNPESDRTRLGGRLPAVATASGRVMLANLSRAAQDELIRQSYEDFPRRSLPEESQLRKQLNRAAEEHFSISQDEFRRGVTAMASPIFRGSGPVVAALSIIGQSKQLSLPQLPSVVRTSAQRVSRQMESLVEATRFSWDG